MGVYFSRTCLQTYANTVTHRGR